MGNKVLYERSAPMNTPEHATSEFRVSLHTWRQPQNISRLQVPAASEEASLLGDIARISVVRAGNDSDCETLESGWLV